MSINAEKHNLLELFCKNNINTRHDIEKIQERATKLVISLKHLSYKDRLVELVYSHLIIEDFEVT